MNDTLTLAAYGDVVLSLSIVLALLLLFYGFLKLWKKNGRMLGMGKSKIDKSRLEVINIQPLDLKRQLALIRFDDQELLVILSDQSCVHLATKPLAKPSPPTNKESAISIPPTSARMPATSNPIVPEQDAPKPSMLSTQQPAKKAPFVTPPEKIAPSLSQINPVKLTSHNRQQGFPLAETRAPEHKGHDSDKP